jgi:hypothetical protein
MLPGAMQLRVDCRSDGAAIRMTEHEEERRLQMVTSVLQAPRDFRLPSTLPAHADDEQLAKAGIENQFGRHP